METPFNPKTLFFQHLAFFEYQGSITWYEKLCGSLELTDRRINAHGTTSAKTFAAIMIYDVIRATTGASWCCSCGCSGTIEIGSISLTQNNRTIVSLTKLEELDRMQPVLFECN